ncbi:MAG: MutS-related protein [Cyclobacteriaceae bacterium]|nr:hypothetical protein [Flammeovirgaceae bacterium]
MLFYLVFLAIGATLVGAILVRIQTQKKIKKIKEELKRQWGKPKADEFDFDRIKKYATISSENSFHQLTEQTLEDIDFQKVFAFADRTTSKVGQQVLYKRMTQQRNDLINPLNRFINFFNTHEKICDDVQFKMLSLGSQDAYYISSLLNKNLLARPKWLWALAISLLVTFSLVVLSFKYPICIVLLLAPLTLNMLVHYWNKGNTYQFIRSFPQLNALIEACDYLSQCHDELANESVKKSIAELQSFKRKSVLIALSNKSGIEGELSQFGNYLLELVKSFLLIEVWGLFWIVKELESKQSHIEVLIEYVGDIDMAISILSLRAGESKTCEPQLVNKSKTITIKGAYHPLIEHCVSNDIHIDGKSVLITGSNMSGKSTFLRTFLINSILAQTIYTCFADEFISPPLRQFSSLRIDDNLFQGKSYYFQEVSTIATFLEASETPYQNLFVLDEVFKGTNTIERIASA